MAVRIDTLRPGILEIAVAGELTQADYQQIVPALEGAIRECGKARLLVQLRQFNGWTIGGIWEELKFDAKHLHDIERLAMVGPRLTDEGMGAFQHPFPADAVEYFDGDELFRAREWISRGCIGRCEIADGEAALE